MIIMGNEKIALPYTTGSALKRTSCYLKSTHTMLRSHINIQIPERQQRKSLRGSVLVESLCGSDRGVDAVEFPADMSCLTEVYHLFPNFFVMPKISLLLVADTTHHAFPLFHNALVLAVGFAAGATFVGLQMSMQQTKRTIQSNTRQALAEISVMDEEEIQEMFGELPSWLAFEDFERGGWINKVVSAAWPYLDEATSNVIVGALDPILQATRPNFLTTLRFERFSFGSVPARIEGVKVYENTGDAVEIDLQVFWAGDPNVILGVRAAQDTLAVPVSLTEIQCKFTLRLIFAPLIGKFPCFGALTITLTEEPDLDFDLRVVGGDITLVPGLAQPLRTYIKALICSYLVWPRCITVPIPGTGYSLPATTQNSRAGLLQIETLSHDALTNDPGELGLEICWPGADVVEEERVKALPDGIMLTSKPISLLVSDAQRQVLRLKWYSSGIGNDVKDQELELQSESTVVLDDLVRLNLFNEPAIDDIKGDWGPVTIAAEFDPVDLNSTVAMTNKSFHRLSSFKRRTKSALNTFWNSIKGVQDTKRAQEYEARLGVEKSSLPNKNSGSEKKSGATMVQLTLRYQALKSSSDIPEITKAQNLHTLVDGYHASSVSATTQVPRFDQVLSNTLMEQVTFSNAGVYLDSIEADLTQALQRVTSLSSSQREMLENIVQEANSSLLRASALRDASSLKVSDEE